MDVIPLYRDNNPLKNIINYNNKQVTSLQIDFSKVKIIEKINISKREKKWSTQDMKIKKTCKANITVTSTP